ncbi:phenylalanyl-tRNA synthetase [Whalleya microplaca]|nr:phenylalanyl-tRNA synthetase [Whalleya microplaca]
MWATRLTTAHSCAGRAIGSPARQVNRCNAVPFLRNTRRLLSQDAWPLERRQIMDDVSINNTTYKKDSWFNIPDNVFHMTTHRLHLRKDHPVAITRQIIESVFPAPTFKYHNNFDPVVTTHQNFDSLGFPPDHPGRMKTDTFYINKDTLLRTHTSAHQADVFRANESDGYLISADVYRRDEIDRSHYPVFHQMEGARSWDRAKVANGDVASAVWADILKLPSPKVKVKDPHPTYSDRNPLQAKHHSEAEATAIAAHLKRSLENMVVELFSRARAAALKADPDFVDEPLKVRWVEAYFPFTSPSWEMEVLYNGGWLEVLGCGIVQQDIYINAGVPSQLGWAFGLGLERLAMLLFNIKDIRVFWSQDRRILGQFKGVSEDLSTLKRYVPVSKHPYSRKDLSFWLPPIPEAAAGEQKGDVYAGVPKEIASIVHEVVGEVAEEVKKVDDFVHPTTGKRSHCYSITYRSFERTLSSEEANKLHDRVRWAVEERLGVELR